jgi:predicted metal-dependent peptidase
MPEAGGAVHRGTRAIQRMVEFAPSTGGLALWVRHQDLPDGTLPVSTDGTTLYYGPTFEALPVEAQAGLVAHEVLHIALRHTQRFHELRSLVGEVDLELYNICADAIVNSTLDHLAWLALPAASVRLDRLLKRTLGITQAVDASLLEWDVERLYRAIDDRRLPSQGGKKRGHGAHPTKSREDGPRAASVRALGAETDADLLPGTDTQGPPENEADQAREWQERIVRGHAGDGAHSMLRALLADVPKTRTPWEHVLRTLLARSLAPSPSISWSRPSRSYIANQGRAGPTRRMPWEPGTSASKSVPRLVVIVDVSGSIAADLMERFAREIEAITRRQEASLVLVVGDDRVRRVERFLPGRSNLRELTFEGGGGTDFTPLLEEASAHDPDIAVVLTDLDGPARYRPKWPVIWAVPESHTMVTVPFGRKLTLSP